MYSAALQRYYNEHEHLPYTFYAQPKRFTQYAIEKRGELLATAYNYIDHAVYFIFLAILPDDFPGQHCPIRTMLYKNAHIDRVIDIRPAYAAKAGGQGDRYTIQVMAQEHISILNDPPI